MNRFQIFFAASVLLLAELAAVTNGAFLPSIGKISFKTADDFYVDDATSVGGDDANSAGDDFYGYYADDDSSSSSTDGSPTRLPTLAPSKQTSSIISFTSNITLVNVADLTSNNYDLNSASQEAIITTNAIVMDISANSVEYIDTYLVAAAEPAAALRGLFSTAALTDDSTPVTSVIVVTRTSVPLSSTGFVNASDAYDYLVELLTTAINNGTYTTVLNGESDLLGANQTLTAQAVSVRNSGASVNSVPSSSHDDDDSMMFTKSEQIGVLVALIVIGLCVVGGVVFWCSKRQNPDDGDESAFHKQTLLGVEAGTNKDTEGFVAL